MRREPNSHEGVWLAPAVTECTLTLHGSRRLAGKESKEHVAKHRGAWRRIQAQGIAKDSGPKAQSGEPKTFSQCLSASPGKGCWAELGSYFGIERSGCAGARGTGAGAKPFALSVVPLVKPLVRGTQASSPNPSVEARPNGKPPGPLPGEVYHPSSGPGALPSVPPHLER